MKITLYSALVEFPGGINHYNAATRDGLRTQIAKFCRTHWENETEEPMPETDEEVITRYFQVATEETLVESHDELDIPDTLLAVTTLHTATIDYPNDYLDLSATSAEELDGLIAAYCRNKWESICNTDEMPRKESDLIEQFFDAAMQQPAGYEHYLRRVNYLVPSAPAAPSDDLPTFTFFCQEKSGEGTIYIGSLEASDVEAAKAAAIRECAEDWEKEPADIHLLGIAAGDVQILHWQDICEA